MVLPKFNEFLTNLKFTVDTFPDGVIHFLDIKSQLIALTFIARTRTPANIPTSPVLNLFPVKLHGLNRFLIAHFKFVAPKSFVTTK